MLNDKRKMKDYTLCEAIFKIRSEPGEVGPHDYKLVRVMLLSEEGVAKGEPWVLMCSVSEFRSSLW